MRITIRIKKGFALIEAAIATMIFAITTILLFQLTASLILKIKEGTNEFSTKPSLWLIQDKIISDSLNAKKVAVSSEALNFYGKEQVSWFLNQGKLIRQETNKRPSVAHSNISSINVVEVANAIQIKITSNQKSISFKILKK